MLLVASLFSSTLYLVALFQLASLYHEFVKRGRLAVRDVAYPAVFLAFTVVLGLGALHSYAQQDPLALHLVPSISMVALSYFLARSLATSKYLERSLWEERKLWGLRLRTYKGRYVGIVSRGGKIYVHESLPRVLTPRELEALLRHEEKHLERTRSPIARLLRALVFAGAPLWSLGGVTLAVLTGYGLCVLATSVAGKVTAEQATTLSFLAFFHLLVSSASLASTYATWAWEHCADVYAAESVGVEAFARALIKSHAVGLIGDCAGYASLSSLSVSVRLEGTRDLARVEVLKLLLLHTLLARGFINALAKPALDTHQPLDTRIRAVRTSCPYSVG